MGSYTDRLFRRNRKPGVKPTATNAERLVSVAIKRDGEVHSRGFKGHAQLRAALGDDMPGMPLPGDVDGFLTSTGRFVTRAEGKEVALAAGQCQPMARELLSSDIDRW